MHFLLSAYLTLFPGMLFSSLTGKCYLSDLSKCRDKRLLHQSPQHLPLLFYLMSRMICLYLGLPVGPWALWELGPGSTYCSLVLGKYLTSSRYIKFAEVDWIDVRLAQFINKHISRIHHFFVVYWFRNILLFIICYRQWKTRNLAQKSGLGVWQSEIGNLTILVLLMRTI